MKLHIGGETIKDGWKVLNIQKNDGVDFVGDLSDLSQFSDDSLKEIYASHVVEHLNKKKIKKTLSGVYRILKKNGKFYISVPDMDVLCHFFTSPLATKKIKFHIIEMIVGGQKDEHDFHYFGWNYEILKDFLEEANFSKVEKVKSFGLFKDTSDYSPFGFPISLNVIGYK